MPAWIWLLVAVAAGGCALAWAVLADRRTHRLRIGARQGAPPRGMAEVDAHVPAYLTQDEVDRLPHPARLDQDSKSSEEGEDFGFGHAHDDFRTGPQGAHWDEPVLLIIDGPLSSMRELTGPLALLGEEAALIVVADDLHDEVVATLAANRRAFRTRIVAARAGRRDRVRLAELTGATQLSSADLRAGYIPGEALGRAEVWYSTMHRTWIQVEPQPHP